MHCRIIYLKSKHSLARRTMHQRASDATKAFTTKAQMTRRPPRSYICISCNDEPLIQLVIWICHYTYMVFKYMIQRVIVTSQLVGYKNKQAKREVHTELHGDNLRRKERRIPLGISKCAATLHNSVVYLVFVSKI